MKNMIEEIELGGIKVLLSELLPSYQRNRHIKPRISVAPQCLIFHWEGSIFCHCFEFGVAGEYSEDSLWQSI